MLFRSATGNSTGPPTLITTGPNAPNPPNTPAQTTSTRAPVSNGSARTSIAVGIAMAFAGVVSGWLV